MDLAVDGFEKASARQLRGRKQFAMKALRFQVLRSILGNPSYRSLSCSVASSELFASFCGVQQIDAIRGAAKSTLDRAAKFFSEKQVRWMHQVLIEMSAEGDRAKEIGAADPDRGDARRLNVHGGERPLPDRLGAVKGCVAHVA